MSVTLIEYLVFIVTLTFDDSTQFFFYVGIMYARKVKTMADVPHCFYLVQ